MKRTFTDILSKEELEEIMNTTSIEDIINELEEIVKDERTREEDEQRENELALEDARDDFIYATADYIEALAAVKKMKFSEDDYENIIKIANETLDNLEPELLFMINIINLSHNLKNDEKVEKEENEVQNLKSEKICSTKKDGEKEDFYDFFRKYDII